jgi:hypothetical protein
MHLHILREWEIPLSRARFVQAGARGPVPSEDGYHPLEYRIADGIRRTVAHMGADPLGGRSEEQR